MVEDKRSELEKAGFVEEVAEEYNVAHYSAYVRTGFPRPRRRFRIVYESQQASIENMYFWMYNAALQDFGFGNVVKTVDTFGASENSSFWGMTEQRKSIQQDKASQYLATIGRMVKELFQIVREIRILKERLALYKGASEGRQADDIALKGYWVDMVEGGTKGGANIYVMANQLGFGTLPDLFFGIYVKDGADVSSVVEEKAKEFNEKVKEVLKRKLATYMRWKEETFKELETRHRFTLRYLRQHWAIIRMYMAWVKPYLRNVQKLQAPDKYDKNPELISSFEGALMEIEFLARRSPTGFKDGRGDPKKPAPTILATFTYRVKPQLQFQADSYQNRGAVHVGRVEVSLRSYGWNEDDVQAYMKYREQETLELMAMVDQSVKDAMDALGNELMQYLHEAGEDVHFEAQKEDKKPKKAPVNLFEPFVALFGGFKDLFGMPFEGMFEIKSDAPKKRGTDGASVGASKVAATFTFQMYKNYKTAHGMPKW
jgi:hypothetical protein